MSFDGEKHPQAEEMWQHFFTTGEPPAFAAPYWYEKKMFQPLAKYLPSDPRCRVCHYPFGGFGGKLVRTFLGLGPSRMNPHLCNICETAASKYRGGAEVELTIIFADVRGSTAIAESMSPYEFSQLIDRFYQVTTKVLYRKNAMVEKLIGDAVTGFFVPGYAGIEHPRVAYEAGKEILHETGHDRPGGPWLPVGIGIHTGIAYVGSVGSKKDEPDIAVLGDTANTGARLASVAGTGQIVISDVTFQAAGIDGQGLEARRLELKGMSKPVDVWVTRN